MNIIYLLRSIVFKFFSTRKNSVEISIFTQIRVQATVSTSLGESKNYCFLDSLPWMMFPQIFYRYAFKSHLFFCIFVTSITISFSFNFLVAKLLNNLKCPSVRPSVRLKRFGRNVIFSAPFQDRRLKFLLAKILSNLKCPSETFWGKRDFLSSFSRQTPEIFRD